MRFIGDLISLILAVVAVAIAGLLWVIDRAERPGPLGQETVVQIAAGSGIGAIAESLVEAGAVEDSRLFSLSARLLAPNRTLKAGEYTLAAGASVRALIEQLAEGRTLIRKLTVAEGLTSAEVVALLAATPALAGEMAPLPAEGSLLPETYHYGLGGQRAALIARMAAAMDETLAELWRGRAVGLPFDTPQAALVLASIVEKETGVAAERRHVAGVFVNRLRRGMRLQSDPTVIYGLTGGAGPLGRPLTRADLEADHPYNTYRIDGLPPHPIANPGRAAIAAALDPLPTGDLYFVADGSGGHVFARTLDEHNRNVANWRRVRDGGGD